MTEPLTPYTGECFSTPPPAKPGILGGADNKHKVTVVAFRKHNAATKKLISSFRGIASMISSQFATTKAYDDSKTSAKPPSTLAKAVRNIWNNLMYEKVQVISDQSVTTELQRFDIAEKVNKQKLDEGNFSEEFYTKIVGTFGEPDFEPLCALLENRVPPLFSNSLCGAY